MKSTEATDTPQPPPFDIDEEIAEVKARIAEDASKEAEAIAAGRAVYDRMRTAEDEAEFKDGSVVMPVCINITLPEFRDFVTWYTSFGGARFELTPSQEFLWFNGEVLVVVR